MKSSDVLEQFALNYSHLIEGDVEILPLYEGGNSLVFKVQVKNNYYVFKAVKNSVASYDVLDYLSQFDDANLLLPLQNNRNRIFCHWENLLFYVMPFLEGCSATDQEGILEAAFSLGKLNGYLSKYRATSCELRSSHYDVMKNEEISRLESISKLCRELSVDWALVRSLNEELGEIKCELSVEYYDVHINNIIFQNCRFKTFIDFEGIGLVSRGLGLSYLIYRLGEKDQRDKIVASYERGAGVKLGLSYLELHRLYRQESLRRVNFIIREFFYLGKSNWVEELDKQISYATGRGLQ